MSKSQRTEDQCTEEWAENKDIGTMKAIVSYTVKYVIDKAPGIVMVMVTIGVVWFCCDFFRDAFDKTMEDRHGSGLNLSVNVSSNCLCVCESSNKVDYCRFGNDGIDRLREIMTDRERICSHEHDRFRAEMGTWLSIFGLLSILVTVIVSTCSYLFQQRSLKEEKEEIFSKIDQKVKEGLSSISKRADHESESLEATAAASAASASVAATAAPESGMGMSNVPGTRGEGPLGEFRDLFARFVKEWPTYECSDAMRERVFRNKIELGIDVLRNLNDQIRKSEGRELIPWLGLLNGVNIYLGQVKRSDFSVRFMEEVRRRRPLTLREEEVAAKLKGLGDLDPRIHAGFYNTLYRKQNGEWQG